MPTYVFEDKETGEQIEKFMSIADRDIFLQDNPNLKGVITSAALIGGTGDRTKPPAGFNEVLSKVSEANPHSKLADQYGKKDALSVKKREIVKKARKKLGPISTT